MNAFYDNNSVTNVRTVRRLIGIVGLGAMLMLLQGCTDSLWSAKTDVVLLLPPATFNNATRLDLAAIADSGDGQIAATTIIGESAPTLVLNKLISGRSSNRTVCSTDLRGVTLRVSAMTRSWEIPLGIEEVSRYRDGTAIVYIESSRIEERLDKNKGNDATEFKGIKNEVSRE